MRPEVLRELLRQVEAELLILNRPSIQFHVASVPVTEADFHELEQLLTRANMVCLHAYGLRLKLQHMRKKEGP